MRTIIIALFSLALVMGCSDDSEPNNTKDSSVTPDKAVTPVEASVKKDGTTATGKCTNAADAKLLATEALQTAVSGKASTCGLGCLTATDPATCATDCVVKGTGLSSACAGCYGGTVLCSIKNCVKDCAADPSSKACRDCQVKNGCISTFYACTGLTPPATPDAGL